MSMVMYIIILIAAKVNCRWTTTTPSIHSSRVRSTSEGFTSSCAIVEEGVPVCQDPEEVNQNFHMLQVYSLQFTLFIGFNVILDHQPSIFFNLQ